ncbi:transposase [Atopococcus tabaci]|uniref:transposase n=1 Tax=Atopococcus tabaci TaxID=269774 RepID=UPI001F0AFD0B|nr:transposase [Atopococcus tabaci]
MDRFREKYTVTAILGALGVARSTYYRWTKEPKKVLSKVESAITELCRTHKYRYGHRKIAKLLKRKYKMKNG